MAVRDGRSAHKPGVRLITESDGEPGRPAAGPPITSRFRMGRSMPGDYRTSRSARASGVRYNKRDSGNVDHFPGASVSGATENCGEPGGGYAAPTISGR